MGAGDSGGVRGQTTWPVTEHGVQAPANSSIVPENQYAPNESSGDQSTSRHQSSSGLAALWLCSRTISL